MTDLRKFIADHGGEFPLESRGHPGQQLARRLRKFCQHSDTTKDQLAEFQALRQTALQAVDTATASDLAKGGEAVGSAAGHDLALGLTTADIGVVVKPQASKRQRVNF